MTRKRIRPGDVLEVEVPDGFAYLHYLGKHPTYGGAIVVSPKQRERSDLISDALFSSGYITFYPAGVAAHDDVVRIVGNLPPSPIPTRLRRAGAIRGTRIENWLIDDEAGTTVKKRLTERESLLPIAAIWNHEFLVDRISQGWRPEQER